MLEVLKITSDPTSYDTLGHLVLSKLIFSVVRLPNKKNGLANNIVFRQGEVFCNHVLRPVVPLVKKYRTMLTIIQQIRGCFRQIQPGGHSQEN